MHIKYFLVPLLLLVLTTSYSQKRTSIDLSYSFGQSFRSVVACDTLNDRSAEEANSNWRIGIGINYSVNKHLVLKTGIRYANYNYTTQKMENLRWPSEFDSNGGYQVDPSLPHELVLSESHRFLSVPLLLRYEIGESNLSPYAELGVSANYYLTTQDINQTDISTVSTSQKRNFTSVNVFGILAFGANYDISEDFQLFVQINYDRQLNSLVKSVCKESLYSTGLEIGLRRNF